MEKFKEKIKKEKKSTKKAWKFAIAAIVIVILIALLMPSGPSIEEVKSADKELLQITRSSWQHYKDTQNDLIKVGNGKLTASRFYFKMNNRYTSTEMIKDNAYNLNISGVDEYKEAVKDLAQSSNAYVKANLDYLDNPNSEDYRLMQAYIQEMPNYYDAVMNARKKCLSEYMDEKELNNWFKETEKMVIEK